MPADFLLVLQLEVGSWIQDYAFLIIFIRTPIHTKEKCFIHGSLSRNYDGEWVNAVKHITEPNHTQLPTTVTTTTRAWIDLRNWWHLRIMPFFCFVKEIIDCKPNKTLCGFFYLFFPLLFSLFFSSPNHSNQILMWSSNRLRILWSPVFSWLSIYNNSSLFVSRIELMNLRLFRTKCQIT